MIKPLKVGFLLPYSGMYPFYGQHTMAGVACALTKNKIAASQFNFMPAYVCNGEKNKCIEEAKRLIFFEGVDVLMGMVNIKVIEELKPMLQNFNKLGFFLDFGEYIPSTATTGENIYSLSMNLWQSQYALGNWAVKEFGPAGQLVMPIYEAGFNLNSSFLEGAAAAGSKGVNNFVLSEAYANTQQLNLAPFFEALEKDTPNFVHALFSGKMANQFLWQWRQSKFYDTVPLVVVENMAYNEALFDVEDMNIKMYSARSWHREMSNKQNKEFVKQFEDFGKQDANVFAMMGYEAGLALSQMLPQLLKGDGAEAVYQLNKKGVEGPRGLIGHQTMGVNAHHPIDIVKIQTAKPRTLQTILASESALGFDTSEIIENTQSGWLNPFVAV
jgi:branched-chain amino acid transport system substrate-binding protein